VQRASAAEQADADAGTAGPAVPLLLRMFAPLCHPRSPVDHGTTAEVNGHEAIFKLIEQYIVPAVSPTAYEGREKIAVYRPVHR
jgi:hypothetical protein